MTNGTSVDACVLTASRMAPRLMELKAFDKSSCRRQCLWSCLHQSRSAKAMSSIAPLVATPIWWAFVLTGWWAGLHEERILTSVDGELHKLQLVEWCYRLSFQSLTNALHKTSDSRSERTAEIRRILKKYISFGGYAHVCPSSAVAEDHWDQHQHCVKR